PSLAWSSSDNLVHLVQQKEINSKTNQKARSHEAAECSASPLMRSSKSKEDLKLNWSRTMSSGTEISLIPGEGTQATDAAPDTLEPQGRLLPTISDHPPSTSQQSRSKQLPPNPEERILSVCGPIPIKQREHPDLMMAIEMAFCSTQSATHVEAQELMALAGWLAGWLAIVSQLAPDHKARGSNHMAPQEQAGNYIQAASPRQADECIQLTLPGEVSHYNETSHKHNGQFIQTTPGQADQYIHTSQPTQTGQYNQLTQTGNTDQHIQSGPPVHTGQYKQTTPNVQGGQHLQTTTTGHTCQYIHSPPRQDSQGNQSYPSGQTGQFSQTTSGRYIHDTQETGFGLASQYKPTLPGQATPRLPGPPSPPPARSTDVYHPKMMSAVGRGVKSSGASIFLPGTLHKDISNLPDDEDQDTQPTLPGQTSQCIQPTSAEESCISNHRTPPGHFRQVSQLAPEHKAGCSNYMAPQEQAGNYILEASPRQCIQLTLPGEVSHNNETSHKHHGQFIQTPPAQVLQIQAHFQSGPRVHTSQYEQTTPNVQGGQHLQRTPTGRTCQYIHSPPGQDGQGNQSYPSGQTGQFSQTMTSGQYVHDIQKTAFGLTSQYKPTLPGQGEYNNLPTAQAYQYSQTTPRGQAGLYMHPTPRREAYQYSQTMQYGLTSQSMLTTSPRQADQDILSPSGLTGDYIQTPPEPAGPYIQTKAHGQAERKGKGRPITFKGRLGSEVLETPLFSGPAFYMRVVPISSPSLRVAALPSPTLYGVRYPFPDSRQLGRLGEVCCAYRELNQRALGSDASALTTRPGLPTRKEVTNKIHTQQRKYKVHCDTAQSSVRSQCSSNQRKHQSSSPPAGPPSLLASRYERWVGRWSREPLLAGPNPGYSTHPRSEITCSHADEMTWVQGGWLTQWRMRRRRRRTYRRTVGAVRLPFLARPSSLFHLRYPLTQHRVL
ncbi:hypothetical protein C0Q70_18422, partial [Pomacea canaliculata]